nr:MAG TPA: hypothetical protein [Caudoviricetes sp.]
MSKNIQIIKNCLKTDKFSCINALHYRIMML